MPTLGQIILESGADVAEIARIHDTNEGGIEDRVLQDNLERKEDALAEQAGRIKRMHEIAGASTEKAASAAANAVLGKLRLTDPRG